MAIGKQRRQLRQQPEEQSKKRQGAKGSRVFCCGQVVVAGELRLGCLSLLLWRQRSRTTTLQASPSRCSPRSPESSYNLNHGSGKALQHPLASPQLTPPESRQNPRVAQCLAAKPHPSHCPVPALRLPPSALAVQSPAISEALPMAGLSDSCH